MGIVSAMATAISGLEANGEMLGVISDNIVNSNTTAFKTSRAEFHSIMAQDILSTVGGDQVGHGVKVGGFTNMFSQGPVTRTNRSTDMAVNGNGFFVVHSDKGLAFTRDGSFRFDKDGWMTSLSGDRVQAFMAGMDNKISSKLGDIRLDFTVIPAKPTGRVEIHANLDARLGVGQALDLTRPEETAHFTTATQIFDSVGNAHSLSVFMNRTSDSTWEWHAMTDGGELTGGVKGQPASVAQGTLTFDMHGKLDSVTQNILNTSFTGGAIPDQGLVFDFGDSLAEQGTGQKGCTMYGSANAVFRNNQNGWGAGVLADTIIDSEGLITGVYSNGQNRTLGQMAMARFDAMERLTKVGANQFKENSQSGQAIIGKANTGGRGAIQTRSLEQSNVDLASEFVDMIKSQRGFQASAKSITTANEMLEEVINLRQR